MGLIGTLRIDKIQARSNSDFDIKSAPIQLYGNSHNSQSDRWIGLKFNMESPDMFSYHRLKFQVKGVWERISIQVTKGESIRVYFSLESLKIRAQPDM